MKELNTIINQQDLMDIYRTLHPITAEYILFSSSLKTYTKINHTLDHKTNLNKVKRTEIT